MYVNLQSLALKDASTEDEVKSKDASRLVLRAIAAACDSAVFVDYAVRQLSNRDLKVLLLPKGHVIVLVNDTEGSPLGATVLQVSSCIYNASIWSCLYLN